MPDDKADEWASPEDGWNDPDVIEGLNVRLRELEKIDAARKATLEMVEKLFDDGEHCHCSHIGLHIRSNPSVEYVRQQIWEAINCPEDME